MHTAHCSVNIARDLCAPSYACRLAYGPVYELRYGHVYEHAWTACGMATGHLPSKPEQRSLLTPRIAPHHVGWLERHGVEGDCLEARRHEAQSWQECVAAYEEASGSQYAGTKKVLPEHDASAEGFPSRSVLAACLCML